MVSSATISRLEKILEVNPQCPLRDRRLKIGMPELETSAPQGRMKIANMKGADAFRDALHGAMDDGQQTAAEGLTEAHRG